MSVSDAIGVAASVSLLALALLCVARASRTPLALPLGLLCLDISGWTGAGPAYDLSGVAAWTLLDHALTPLTAPLVLHFVLVFVGRRRERRKVLGLAFAAGGALTVASATALVWPELRPFVGSPTWAALLLIAALPTMLYALSTLVRHLRAVTDPLERARTWLILVSFGLGTLLGATDEVANLVPIPRMGNVGMAVAVVPLSAVALRFRLFERGVSVRAATWFLALAGSVALAAMAVWNRFDANVAVVAVASGIASIAAVAVTRRWLSQSTDRQERIAQLATVGRFSAQMAHDLKNPLAALKGAAQLLREDLANPSPNVDRARFLDLMLAQIERLDELVNVYGRLARVDPMRAPLDANQLVRDVLTMEALVSKEVSVTVDLADDLPECSADREMITRVLENLVRNALEAMPSGGSLRVRTARVSLDKNGGSVGVAITVEDTGHGMDARTRDRALDDFFTTKAHGSGLGLAFVRRVADAHGGEVDLASTEGRGTVVTLRLPLG
jgi:two-component system sensor histidine kinase HydH